MNKERGQILLTALESMDDKNFDYGVFFRDLRTGDYLRRGLETNLCGTVGCVAGHTAVLFKDQIANVTKMVGVKFGLVGWEEISGEILELSYADRFFLFLAWIDTATKQDAIRRLKHLLNGGSHNDYDWIQETTYAVRLNRYRKDYGYSDDQAIDFLEDDISSTKQECEIYARAKEREVQCR